jgi:Mg2+ and Co2+ transporter CorA
MQFLGNSRNDTVHGYNEETANKIFYDIIEEYYDAFKELLESLRKQKQTRKL